MATKTVTAARSLAPSGRRRATTTVLVLSSLAAVAAAFGPIWIVRAGVFIAIAAAVTTAVLAWREVTAERRAHAAAALASTKAHGEILRIERSHNSAVLQVVTDRNVAASAEITNQQAMIAQLRGEISSLKGDRAALTAEIARREGVISSLRDTVRAQEDELEGAREALATAVADAEAAAVAQARFVSTDEEAEVHAMPRRVVLDHDDQPRRVIEPDLRDASTVVDLDPNGPESDAERGDVGAHWATEPVLPNYEEDRRLA